MSDPTPDPQPGSPPPEAQNPPAEPMIPKSRFDEINSKLRKLEADAARREAEQRTQAEQEAAAKGEFERLATERGSRLERVESEHATLQERFTALTEAMEQHIKARIKGLPEEMRELLGDGDVLARYTQLGKLEQAAAKLTTARPAPAGTPPGPRIGGPSTPPAPDVAATKRTTIDYTL